MATGGPDFIAHDKAPKAKAKGKGKAVDASAPEGASAVGPGSGWQHGAAAPSEQSNRLPWVLVAMLAALSIVLGTLYGSQRSELNRLRAQASATPVATAAPAQQTQTQAAQPSQNPEAVAAMKKLPHRTAGDPTALGKVDAPVVMVEWSDYRCPFCSVWARDTFPQLKGYVDSGSLRIEHRDLVLFGDQSMQAALAGRAAGNQGKFWEFSGAVHAVAPTNGHPNITHADLVAFAKKAGVPDIAKFEKDMAAPATRAAVEKDNAEARSLGLSGTPFFVINTTPLSGAQPLQVFEQTLRGYGATK